MIIASILDVVAAEQSLSRREFDEAQRLIELIERANGNASALQRLRDQLARQRSLPVSPVEVLVAETTFEPAKGTALLPAEPAKILPPPTTSVPTVSTIADGRAASPKAPALEPAPTPVAILPTPTSSPTAAVAQPRTEARTPAQLRDRNPRYPPMALNRKIEGSVELAFTIKADGSVTDVRVLSANPPGIFEEAAIATDGNWYSKRAMLSAIWSATVASTRGVQLLSPQTVELATQTVTEGPPLFEPQPPYARWMGRRS